MRALLLDQPGDVQTMRVGEIPIADPGPGEVRIAVHASGLNPSDFQRAGYEVPGVQWPAVMGIDVAGAVDALGPGITQFRVGDRVACHSDMRRRGGFAEYAVVDAAALAIVPEGVPFEAAAAVASAGLTAYQAIDRRLRVGPEDTVLITGAAGGVGGYATQVAKLRGARVIATDAGLNEDFVLSLGADVFIDYQTQNIDQAVKRATGNRGVDAVLDTVGTGSATANLALLAFSGRIATTAGGPDLTKLAAFNIGVSWHEIALGAAHLNGDLRARRELAKMLRELLELIEADRLDPMLSSTISLEEVPATLAAMSRFEVRGKAVAILH